MRKIKLRQSRVVTTDEVRARMAIELSREVELGKVEKPEPKLTTSTVSDTTLALGSAFQSAGVSADALRRGLSSRADDHLTGTIAMDMARGLDQSIISIRGVDGMEPSTFRIADSINASVTRRQRGLLFIEDVQVMVDEDICTRSFVVRFVLRIVIGDGLSDRRVMSVNVPGEAAATPVAFMEEVRRSLCNLMADFVVEAVVPTMMERAVNVMQGRIAARGGRV